MLDSHKISSFITQTLKQNIMKKQQLKTLQLGKKAISTLTSTKVKGGSYSHSNAHNGTQEHCCYPL
jgi:hypothetical protein